MAQHVGKIIQINMTIASHIFRMKVHSRVFVFLLGILLASCLSITEAQPPQIPSSENDTAIIETAKANLPTACIEALDIPATAVSSVPAALQQECESALALNISNTLDYYTERLADTLSFCIDNPVQEREAAFNFKSSLSFMFSCLIDTEGLMLDLICSAGEIKEYINFLMDLIKSSDSETTAIPIATINCNESNWSQGCEDGWSRILQVSTTAMNKLYLNASLIPTRRNGFKEARCCEGFFCPRGLACMIPCPLGAYCPKANFNNNTGLCDPYEYQVTPGQNFSCGGANMWADLSNSNGTFCPAGSYCPTTTNLRNCSSGHYCRQGSTEEKKCFQLTSCDAQATTQKIQTYGLMIIVVLVTLLLLIYNCSDQVMHIREKRKMKTREKAAREVREHLSAVKHWKVAVQAAKRFNRTFSRHTSRNSEEMHVLAPPGLMRSSDVYPTQFSPKMTVTTIDEDSSYHEAVKVSRPVTERRSEPYYTDRLVEEDLHEPMEVPPVKIPADDGKKATTRKWPPPQTQSQILRYAYGQIEKEKSQQNKRLNWTDVLVQTGQDQPGNSRRFKIEITFKDLSLILKGNGKKILCNVTGTLSPGRVTAVMGPSGAGKTTFLNALAGKAYSSTTTGLVLINGKPDPIKCYRKIIGFVPQDDIVHGNLTVEENLWFSARYRLPVKMLKEEKVLVVERIIDSLGLQHIRNSKVGTVEKRGISGGQRKRVNVGLEMVMEPSLLILDEPTSGLDSTSSQLVLKALRREAYVGVNVGVVLHQPSYGLFKMFDDVMFLAKGGRTVYLGPVDEVENYFATMGIMVPERINPPDHYMDVLEGISKPEGNPQFDPNLLPVAWMRYKGYEIPEDLQAMVLEMDVSPEKIELKKGPDHEPSRLLGRTKSFAGDLWEEFKCYLELRWDDFKGTFSKMEDLSNRRTPGFYTQFKLIISRLALQRFREARLQSQDFLILLLAGACLGTITPTKDSSLGSNNYTYVIIALSLLCMIAALRTFTNDKLQFWRESASSINRVAYFLAKDTVDHFNTVLKPVVFLSMFYFFNDPRSSFAENYIVTIALVYCVVGIAYIFAITMESGPAQLWSVFLPIIFTLLATKKDVAGLVKTLQLGTYAWWAQEAYVIANARKYSGVWLITRCAALAGAGYAVKDWALCLCVLFGYGFAARCIALLCLLLCNRKRQQ